MVFSRARIASPLKRRSRPWASPSSAAPEGRVRIEGAGARGPARADQGPRPRQLGHGDPPAHGVARRTAVRQRAHRRRIAAPTPDGASRRAAARSWAHASRRRAAAGRRSRMGGGARLHGIDYALPMASAQVKSALLLAALRAERHDDGPLAGPEPRPHRAHAAEHGRAARPVDRWRGAYGHAERTRQPTRLRSARSRPTSAPRPSSSSRAVSARATDC